MNNPMSNYHNWSLLPAVPTMYDLPSDDPEEPGLPDEFHLLQPQLLRNTFIPPYYNANQVFVAADLNLYFDLQHPLWHKRPDWFAVLGIDRSQQLSDSRLSYVMWQEQVAPTVVIELLSPGTESEDLGITTTTNTSNIIPSKWMVYERILAIPYYLVYSRYSGILQAFILTKGQYISVSIPEQRFWLAEVGLGLGIWTGIYEHIQGQWLRWYNAAGTWILTPAEQAAEAKIQLHQAHKQVQRERWRTQEERRRANVAEQELSKLRVELEQLKSITIK